MLLTSACDVWLWATPPLPNRNTTSAATSPHEHGAQPAAARRLPSWQGQAVGKAHLQALFSISSGRPVRDGLLYRPLVNPHHRVQELVRVFFAALKGVPTDNRPKPTAVADRADFIEEFFVTFGRAAREDDNPFIIERALHDVADAFGRRLNGHVMFLIRLLRVRQFDMTARQLDLNDMRPHLGGDLGGIATTSIAVSPALLRSEPRGYDHTTTASPLDLASLAISRSCSYMVWAADEPGIDRKPDRDTAEPERVVNAARHGREGVFSSCSVS